MAISELIRIIKDRQKLSTDVMAEWLNMTPQRFRQKLNDNIWSFDDVDTFSAKTGFAFNWIAQGDGPEMESEFIQMMQDYSAGLLEVREPNTPYLSGKTVRPVAVTVDRSGKELISYVPVKAQAGYMKGYGDPKFIEKLPAFTLPNFNEQGSYRMFQVSGDSMLQLGSGGLHDGDIVIGQYLEDIFSLRDNRVYVIVSTEGVVVKRVLNRLTTSDKALILKSDNKNGQHPDRVLHAKDILEVWELKAFISRQLSFATDLWELINDLQASNAILSERVDIIDSKTRSLNPPTK